MKASLCLLLTPLFERIMVCLAKAIELVVGVVAIKNIYEVSNKAEERPSR